VYNGLGPLQNQVVFVGGATISLYLEKVGPDIRPTDDVDVVIEICNLGEYAALERQLRSMGFKNDKTSGVICRYIFGTTTVDVLPTEGKVLGFSNRWYPEGFLNAIDYTIDEQHTIKIFSPPYFLASKLDAFNDRGKKDGRTSTDFEDIIFLLEHRRTIWEECEKAPAGVRDWLREEFGNLSRNIFLTEWIDANIEFRSPPSTYYILEKIKEFGVNR
jgi:predicted nucleotidyltransferase